MAGEIVKRSRVAASFGITGASIFSLALILSGCGNGPTNAEDPASHAGHGVASKEFPTPTGSPYPKDAVKREAEAQMASPNPSLSEETGQVPADDTVMMTHYLNRRFVATSAWRLKCGNRYDTVAVGAVGGAGYVARGQVDDHGANSESRILAAPSGFGKLSIISAGCDGVRLRDDTGKTLTYLPLTNSWKD